MYAAISGLDANQSMLNDTANDLANVNTIGYKASSITFADSLTQETRGASGPTATNGGSNPVQIRLDPAGLRHPQRNDGGLLPIHQQPAGHRDRGRRLPARRGRHSTSQRTVYERSAGEHPMPERGCLATQLAAADNRSGEYVIGRDADPPATASRHRLRTRENKTPTCGSRRDRQTYRWVRTACLTTPRQKPTSSASPRVHLDGDIPQRSGPGTTRWLAVGSDRQLGRTERSRAKRRLWPDGQPASRAVQCRSPPQR